MVHTFRIILIFIAVLWSTRAALAIDSAEIFRASKGSVVLVATMDAAGQPKSIGSGFYVGDGARIATNLHVIQGAAKVFVKIANGRTIEITEVAGIDTKLDVAILVSPQRIPPLTLATTEPEIGDDILAIGNPQGLEATLSTGIVSGIRNDQGNQYYQITAPISPGSSGGPIISDNGRVLGIASFYVSGGQNLNFAVPAAYILRLLNKQYVRSIAAISIPKSTPKNETKEAAVQLIDTEVSGLNSKYTESTSNLNILGGLSNPKLLGYVQNLTQYPVKNIKIAINYYKGKANIPRNNRGYHECTLFESDPLNEIEALAALLGTGQRGQRGQTLGQGQAVRPQTAERFSCNLTKWQKGLRVVYQIIDYDLVR